MGSERSDDREHTFHTASSWKSQVGFCLTASPGAMFGTTTAPSSLGARPQHLTVRKSVQFELYCFSKPQISPSALQQQMAEPWRSPCTACAPGECRQTVSSPRQPHLGLHPGRDHGVKGDG